MPAATERRSRRALAGLTDSQRPAVKLHTVELFNGLRHKVGLAELDEREAAGPVGGAIQRQDDVCDRTDLGEYGIEVLLGRLVAQVADEDSG